MRKADNLPPYSAVVKKSRSLNFLDPSGPAWPVTGVLCFEPVTIMSLNLLDVSFVDLRMIHPRFITDQACILQYTANTNTANTNAVFF